MSSDRLRLFIAADLPPGLLQELDEALASLRSRPELETARWTRPANQHVTLKFLGWVDPPMLDEIGAATASVAARHEPATITLTGLGSFPSPRRARVLWVGLDDPTGVLTALASGLDASLAPLGFEPEKRAFTPHLTLARFKPPASVAGVLFERPEVAEPAFRLGHLALYRSHLHPKGARYEALGTIPLGAESKGP